MGGVNSKDKYSTSEEIEQANLMLQKVVKELLPEIFNNTFTQSVFVDKTKWDEIKTGLEEQQQEVLEEYKALAKANDKEDIRSRDSTANILTPAVIDGMRNIREDLISYRYNQLTLAINVVHVAAASVAIAELWDMKFLVAIEQSNVFLADLRNFMERARASTLTIENTKILLDDFSEKVVDNINVTEEDVVNKLNIEKKN